MNDSSSWHAIYKTLIDFVQRQGVGILIVSVLIFAVGRIVSVAVGRYARDDEKKHHIKKWTRYITAFCIVVLVLILYNTHVQGDTPFYLFIVGIFLAGIAISMRDIFSNFVGWIVIISSKGFKNGDRIKIGTIIGDVIDIGILRTTIAEIGDWVEADQSTGRLISMPNSIVIGKEIINYTQGYDFIWDELRVLITFESDWQRAEEIVNEIALKDFGEKREQIQERLKNVKRDYLLRYNYITPKIYITIKDSGVELALRYLVRARRRRTLEDYFAREILLHFKKEKKIDFAYPTMRIYKQDSPPENNRHYSS